MRYILIALLLFHYTPAKKYKVGLNLEVGATYNHSYDMSAEIDQKIMGMDIEVGTSVSGDMTFTVTDVEDGVYSMEAAFTSLGMDMTSQFFEMSAHTDDEDPDMFGQVFKAMMNQPFNVKMKRSGKIEEITGLEKMMENTLASFGGLSSADVEQVSAQLEGSFGEAAFKGNIEMVTWIFPEETKVSVGETWTNQVRLQSGMNALMNNTYKLVSANKKTYTIEVSSEIITDDEAMIELPMAGDATIDMKGTMTGTFTVDAKTNWIKSADLKQDMKGNVSVGATDQLPDGMEMEMSFTTYMEVSN